MGLSKATGSCRLLCRALHKSLLESATLFRSWQSKKSDVGYRERCRPALQRYPSPTNTRFRVAQWSPSSVRRVLQEGQTPRPLQE
jgi:hypothetical protein